MTKPVNLNKVRKARARAEKRALANQNAVKFGRSKSQKAADDLETLRASKLLDGQKRDT